MLPRIDWSEGAPAVVTIENADWEIVDAFDNLIVHAVAALIPELQNLLNSLGFDLGHPPRCAPGDGVSDPRPWQIKGAGGEPDDCSLIQSPADYDAAATSAAREWLGRDPEEQQDSGAASSGDLVDIIDLDAPEPSTADALDTDPPVLAEPQQDLDQQAEAEDLVLGNDKTTTGSPLVNQGEEVAADNDADGESAAEGAH